MKLLKSEALILNIIQEQMNFTDFNFLLTDMILKPMKKNNFFPINNDAFFVVVKMFLYINKQHLNIDKLFKHI